MKTNYSGAALESKINAETWAEDFSDLLTCYNGDAVNRTLLGYFATNKRGDESIEYRELCAVFLDLVTRRVLVPEFQSDIANEQMAEMLKIAAYVPPAPPIDPAAKAQAEHEAAITQCASDFRSLSGTAFKNKWLGVRRALYEEASQTGRI